MKFKDVFKKVLQVGAVVAGVAFAGPTGGASLALAAVGAGSLAQEDAQKQQKKATQAAIDEQTQAQERLIQQQKQAELEIQEQAAKIYGAPVEIVPKRSDEVTEADLQKIQNILQPTQQKLQDLQTESGSYKVIQEKQTTAIQDLGSFVKDISKSIYNSYYDIQTLKAQSRPAEYRGLSAAEGTKIVPDKESDIMNNVQKYMPVAVIAIIILFIVLRKKRG